MRVCAALRKHRTTPVPHRGGLTRSAPPPLARSRSPVAAESRLVLLGSLPCFSCRSLQGGHCGSIMGALEIGGFIAANAQPRSASMTDPTDA
jgi:hypothetical protein